MGSAIQSNTQASMTLGGAGLHVQPVLFSIMLNTFERTITDTSLSHKRGEKALIDGPNKEGIKDKQRRSRVETEQRLISVALELIR
jgi:hypothetical protein